MLDSTLSVWKTGKLWESLSHVMVFTVFWPRFFGQCGETRLTRKGYNLLHFISRACGFSYCCNGLVAPLLGQCSDATHEDMCRPYAFD
ncbi:hypothetical protein BaRGS_00025669 [Batillaria attramentaria]|uniref:Secreted protein n=1 Tax=Batillaria attramentaria TaxID=370345 RepID=A0ABD0K7P5_9CAEN